MQTPSLKFFLFKVWYTDLISSKTQAKLFCVPFLKIAILLIKPKFRNSKGLLNRHLTYVRKHFDSPFSNQYNYRYDKDYRYKTEAEGYAIHYASVYDSLIDAIVEEYAKTIISKYKINLALNGVIYHLSALIKEEFRLKESTPKYINPTNFILS